jgi:hypothetical protein
MDFMVYNSNGEKFPNLVGVFARAFPIAVGRVVHGIEQVRFVSYYGERYEIRRVK